MSYSSLYVIDKRFRGKKINEYKNSWLFSPIVWRVLASKYASSEIQTPYGYKKSIILDREELFPIIKERANNYDNTPDRICWELSNQQIFFVKDKELISKSIKQFIEQNKAYEKGEDNISVLKQEHIIERFNEIANDIISIDKEKYLYFAFKNNSVDDSVQNWFSHYDEKNDEYIERSLKDCKNFVTEFVVIKDNKISEFIGNINMKY